ncbi:hypothetical protein CPC08DRAFT_723801 [Agrocybe pediades]|nr:hypothetical protein CPC08DRAFT_723801 [Agrocybe pediades]
MVVLSDMNTCEKKLWDGLLRVASWPGRAATAIDFSHIRPTMVFLVFCRVPGASETPSSNTFWYFGRRLQRDPVTNSFYVIPDNMRDIVPRSCLLASECVADVVQPTSIGKTTSAKNFTISSTFYATFRGRILGYRSAVEEKEIATAIELTRSQLDTRQDAISWRTRWDSRRTGMRGCRYSRCAPELFAGVAVIQSRPHPYWKGGVAPSYVHDDSCDVFNVPRDANGPLHVPPAKLLQLWKTPTYPDSTGVQIPLHYASVSGEVAESPVETLILNV